VGFLTIIFVKCLQSREVRSAKEAFSEQLYGSFTGKILVLYKKIEAASI